jgi:hypothetical protein
MINNGIEYKGIFYNETKEKRYYEGGAHFNTSNSIQFFLN